jgi:hypothetical protein
MGFKQPEAILQETRTIISGENFKTSKPFFQKTGRINSLITATVIIKLNIFCLKLLQYFKTYYQLSSQIKSLLLDVLIDLKATTAMYERYL